MGQTGKIAHPWLAYHSAALRVLLIVGDTVDITDSPWRITLARKKAGEEATLPGIRAVRYAVTYRKPLIQVFYHEFRRV